MVRASRLRNASTRRGRNVDFRINSNSDIFKIGSGPITDLAE